MTTFHPFLRLPYTLRARIWEWTVEPRCIDVRIDYRNGVRYLMSPTPAPAVLGTCREARTEGLYQQAFSELAQKSGRSRQYVWVNLKLDMISIGWTYFRDFNPVAPIIRRLKCERKNSGEWFNRFEYRDFHIFVNLEELHVVCADGFMKWHGVTTKSFHWPCGKENVLMVDPVDGRMMKVIEMDKMLDKELEEHHRQEQGGL